MIDFKLLAVNEAKSQGIDPNLVQAICTVESAWNPWAVRFEPTWRYFDFVPEWASRMCTTIETERNLQAISYGLMQVMGSVARELGHANSLLQLTDPQTGIIYGCKQLKRLMTRFSEEAEIIAAYNAGSPRKTPGGMFVNQGYVDRVHRVLDSLRNP